jgi:glycosyltransferase involved in cell wall biosynthesis
MHKIELIITCVNRVSFLKETLPLNKGRFDNVVVVTSPSDYETQLLCKKEEVDCLPTNVFYKDGAPFNKGHGINYGLERLKYNEWVVLADCDILFLPLHNKLFRDPTLNKELLYGCPRIIIKARTEYLEFLKQGTFFPESLDLGPLINRNPSELGVGFFQMFHRDATAIQSSISKEVLMDDETFNNAILPIVQDSNYPRVAKAKGDIYPSFPHAGGSDSHFRHFFAEKNLMAFVQIPVLHLGDEGKNHTGTNTRTFQ